MMTNLKLKGRHFINFGCFESKYSAKSSKLKKEENFTETPTLSYLDVYLQHEVIIYHFVLSVACLLNIPV